tara:strand:+ start:68 stop:364 length:297 start_codon:yes stop_codon:yes gene_type:complete
MIKHYNVTGNSTEELISPNTFRNVINGFWITNKHASDAVVVDLYVEKLLTGTFYYLKSQSIAVSNYLQVKDIRIENGNGFGVYIKLNNSDSDIDIIFN